jgi:citrate synthase
MLARLGPSKAKHEGSIAEALFRAQGKQPLARELQAVTAALVLVQDHELNPSTFAARVAASTGADLPSCLCAALGALHGPLHGAASQRVEALLDEIPGEAAVASRLEARARRGEAIPGFNHPLYPDGDPRARLLLELAFERGATSARLQVMQATRRHMLRERGEHPNIDFALVATALAAGLSRGSASRIFLVGRTAGFVAHVLEQRESGSVLRPRARYVGV